MMRHPVAAGPRAWRSVREVPAILSDPANVRRTITIALVVGTIFFAMNQAEVVLSGAAGPVVWLKALLTYLTPLVVSNLGMLAATHTPSDVKAPGGA